jgi:tripartite ATP-independent transporter DctP family solute receptor
MSSVIRLFKSAAALSLLLALSSIASSAAEPEWDKQPWINAPQVTLRAGYNTVQQYPHGRAIEWFAHRLAERTGENLKVQTFPSEALGSEAQMFEGVMLGSLDIAKAATGSFSGTIPEFGVLDLPYLFRDLNHMMKVLEGDVGKLLEAKLEERGVKGLFWMEQGTRSFYTVKKPITMPEDLKGMKIRTLPSPVMSATMEAMGAAPTSMGFGELYLALKQGVIDGAENSPDAIWFGKQYEVTKFYSLTNHFRSPVIVVMNKQKFDALPKEYQDIVMRTSKDAQDWAGSLYSDLTTALLQKLEAAGMKVNQLDETKFREAVKPVYAKFGKQYESIISMIQNTH